MVLPTVQSGPPTFTAPAAELFGRETPYVLGGALGSRPLQHAALSPDPELQATSFEERLSWRVNIALGGRLRDKPLWTD